MMRPGTAVKRNFKVAAPKVQAKAVCHFTTILFLSFNYLKVIYFQQAQIIPWNTRYLSPILLGRIKTPRSLPLFEKARLRSSFDSSRVWQEVF